MVAPGSEFREWHELLDDEIDAAIADNPLVAINETRTTALVLRGYAEGLNAPPLRRF